MAKTKIPKSLKGGTSFALDKHRRIVSEMPVHVEKRMQDIAARNEILNGTEAYNHRLERDRVTCPRGCKTCPRGCKRWLRSIT